MIKDENQEAFDCAAKKVLNQPSLSEAQFKQLERLQQPSAPMRRARQKAFFAATILAGFLLFSFWGPLMNSPDALVLEIAEEVTLNHKKLKPLEILGASVVEVSGYFTALDFLPISSRLITSSLQFAGGRYCSIKGSTAAQLRYQNEALNWVTLYETHFNATKFPNLPILEQGEEPIVVYDRGYRVSIWIEKGLVMALVE